MVENILFETVLILRCTAIGDCLKIERYRKVPKFSRKLCCKLPKIQEKRANLGVFHQKDADGIANSEDPDQTAPLGAV